MKIGWGCLIGCSCFVIILIVSIILFALSFGTVNIEEWGLIRDITWSNIRQTPKGAGRYLIGLGKEFIIFPRSMIYVTFDADGQGQAQRLAAWSKEGLNVYIDATIFITLNETKLHDFYHEFGDTWYAYIVRSSYSAIKSTTVQFPTIAFFEKREEIGQAIQRTLTSLFNQKTLGAVQVQEFELRYIAFDSEIETILEDKLIQYQYKKTAEQLNITSNIQRETDLIFVEAQNNITVINAQAQAAGYLIKNLAQTQFFSTVFQSYINSYKVVFEQLGINDDQDKLKFIYATEISQVDPQVKSYVGLNTALLKP